MAKLSLRLIFFIFVCLSVMTGLALAGPEIFMLVHKGGGFADTFDPVSQVWTHAATVGVDDWALSTAQSHSSTHSYHSVDVEVPKEDYLRTSAIVIPSNAWFVFWHTYNFENTYDGGSIEISTNGGSTYSDLGTHITSGGYNGVATDHPAWTGGTIGAFTQVVVDLSSYAGQTAFLRFRVSCDSGGGGEGWYIDDVSVGAMP